jgi:NTE family protein
LVEAGFDFAEVDVFIGTSAGAVAGAWWASSQASSDFVDALICRVEDPRVAEMAESMAIDFDLVATIYGLLGQATAPLAPSVCRQICELASAVSPPDDDEDWNVNGLAAYVPVAWPERFRAVVVRARDGEVRMLGPTDGVAVARGVAASAAAPGLVSAVRIGSELYVDGGARSPTNADLARAFGLDRCLVLSPVTTDTPLVGEAAARVLETEVHTLRTEGIAVAVLTPGETERTAFGSNLLDRSKLRDVIRVGIERGRRDGTNLAFV